jgi:hypothetical protein
MIKGCLWGRAGLAWISGTILLREATPTRLNCINQPLRVDGIDRFSVMFDLDLILGTVGSGLC